MNTVMSELDDDLISPSSTSNIEVDKTFVVDTDNSYYPKGLIPESPSISDGPLGAQIPNELPKADIVFKLIGGDERKLATLQEVESQLLENSGISQESAQYIHDRTGDFLQTSTSLARYTKTQSQIGLSGAKKYLQTKIATESTDVYGRLGDFVKTYFNSQYNSLKTFLENDKDALVYSIEMFTSGLFEQLRRLSISPNFVVKGEDDEFVNLYTEPVADAAKVVPSDIQTGYKKIVAALKSLSQVVCKSSLYDLLILTGNGGESVEMYIKPDQIQVEDHLSFEDIMRMLNENELRTTVSELFTFYQENYLPAQQKTIGKILDLPNQDAVSIATWYMENEEDIYSLMENVHRAQALTVLIPAMLMGTQASLDAFLAVA